MVQIVSCTQPVTREVKADREESLTAPDYGPVGGGIASRVAVRPMRVVVVGQGYVGLPLALHAADAGHHVIGFDTDRAKIEDLKSGRSPIEDIADDQLRSALRGGRYRPSSRPRDLVGFDIAVIAVPTPLAGGAPDLSFVRAAGHLAGVHLRAGALVVLESTSYPGTTQILGDVLESASGLKRGVDFGLGFSPERIDPGNRYWTVATTPKIVSGIDTVSLARVAEFYNGLIDRVVLVDRCEEAELAKLLENTFRAVNVALVNELAEIARRAGVDLRRALAAAATKPFGFMAFDPGPGIGGHCLPVDPIYLSWWAEQAGGNRSALIDTAAQINNSRPGQVVDRLAHALRTRDRDLAGAQILLLGLAYKPGSGDIRESPAIEVAQSLTAHGAHVVACDPFVSARAAADAGIVLADDVGLELVSVDAVVVMTDHDCFDYERIATEAAFVLDCRGRLAVSSTVEQL
ncbi:nucleotide sugar dehydrogenase [Nocardia sp. 004]|uniref:nucleotide sugar dehydrogenase n=1 Tax=Nocardia sp. 004 TaxID=3385978 RepID=UPI0039A2EDF5